MQGTFSKTKFTGWIVNLSLKTSELFTYFRLCWVFQQGREWKYKADGCFSSTLISKIKIRLQCVTLKLWLDHCGRLTGDSQTKWEMFQYWTYVKKWSVIKSPQSGQCYCICECNERGIIPDLSDRVTARLDDVSTLSDCINLHDLDS